MNDYCNKENNNHNNNNNNNNNNGAYCYYHPREFLVGVCPLCLNDKLLVLAAKQGLKNRPKSLKFLPTRTLSHNNNNNDTKKNCYKSKPSITGLPKIFALGSFLNRKDVRNRRFHKNSDRFDVIDFADDLDSTSTSLEDESSFISIKFGDNGVAVASWDNKSNTTNSSTVSKVSLDNCTMSWSGQTSVKPKCTSCNCPVNYTPTSSSSKCKCKCKCVVEHAEPRAPLRWRNRIGQLFQVIRWKRSTSAGGNNAGKCEGVKVARNNNKGWIRSLNIRTRK